MCQNPLLRSAAHNHLQLARRGVVGEDGWVEASSGHGVVVSFPEVNAAAHMYSALTVAH